MPRLSAFTPLGLLAMSAKPSRAEIVYDQIVRGLTAFDMSTGTRQEAFVYALAMAIGRADGQLVRAGNQAHPESAYDLIPVLEQAYQVVPSPGEAVSDRAAALAAIDALSAGGRLADLKAGLYALFGSKFLGVFPTRILETPAIEPPESIAFTVHTPSDMKYDPVSDLVWLADSASPKILGLRTNTRQAAVLADVSGLPNCDGGNGWTGSQQIVLDANYVYACAGANAPTLGTPQPARELVLVIDRRSGNIVGEGDLGNGFQCTQLATDGKGKLYAVARPNSGSPDAGSIQRFDVQKMIAGTATLPLATAEASSPARAYQSIAYDSATGLLIAGTYGATVVGGQQQLVSLNPATMAEVSVVNHATATDPAFYYALAAGGCVWFATLNGTVLKVAPSTLAITRLTVSVVETSNIGLDSVGGTLLVGSSLAGNIISRLNLATGVEVSTVTSPSGLAQCGVGASATTIENYLWMGCGASTGEIAVFTADLGTESLWDTTRSGVSSSVANGPGNWVDPGRPGKYLKLIDPVATVGTAWVGYESLDPGDLITESWAPTQTFPVGAFVVPLAVATGFTYQCTTSFGPTSSTEPTWPTTPGLTVTDGLATWTCLAPTSPTLTVGETVTVQGENSASAERVTVLAVSPSAAFPTANPAATPGLQFQATFAGAHDPGSSVLSGSFPYWWSTGRSLIVVLDSVTANDRDSRRKVHEFLRRAAKGYDTWAIVGAQSSTNVSVHLTGVSAGAPMGVHTLGEFTLPL